RGVESSSRGGRDQGGRACRASAGAQWGVLPGDFCPGSSPHRAPARGLVDSSVAGAGLFRGRGTGTRVTRSGSRRVVGGGQRSGGEDRSAPGLVTGVLGG